jgi:N-acetylglucosamine kinase-like BadF-type ATPase
MILIADAGATKTDWCLLDCDKNVAKEFSSKGVNCNYLCQSEIEQRLYHALSTGLSCEDVLQIRHVYYFGSGCSSTEKQHAVEQIIKRMIPHANANADHDVKAAAISLCGTEKGIACILGTGSNACVYDGIKICRTLLSLGYLLGDEGSGTDIGKKTLTAYLKTRMPDELQNAFRQKYGKQPAEMVKEMYNAPNYAAFFSQFTYFVKSYIEHPFLQHIVKTCFVGFLQEQVLIYPEATYYEIHFVGSIAVLFEQQLQEACSLVGLQAGKIIQKPMTGLIKYYQTSI